MTRTFTRAGLITTVGCIVLDVVGVGIVGDAVAKHLGFSSSVFMPVSALICVVAGYAANQRGMSALTAGSMVTSLEMIAYLLGGDLPHGILPQGHEVAVGTVIVMVVSLGGAALGGVGGWIAQRRTVLPAASRS
ncbi:MAG TPA: hypothetical protein VGM77_05940 [Gemmatimonadales bacterium]|jgi:hypothetical protein